MQEHNPWWKGKEFIEEDEDFVKWKKSKIKWFPRLIEKINLEPFSLHFIFGPRQVGKTTLLKLLIKKLLDSGIEPKSIFYFKCEQLTDFKELDVILKEYQKIKDREKIKTSYLFLDEITFPKEWFRSIKWHIDMGNFKNDVLILTGSLSMFVKKEIETFPGRRGKGKDFVFYPLSFREFVSLFNSKIIEKIDKFEKFEEEEIIKKSNKALPWLGELNKIFEIYLQCGGFPLSLKSMLEENKISNEIFDVYLSWIRGDIAKLKRNEGIAKRIVKAIIEKVPSTISFHNIAKEFEIKSHKTVFYYIDILEKLFLAKVLYFIEPNKATEVFYKQRKVHLIDPFLYHLFSYWCMTPSPKESIIVESVVASHLSRKFNVGYWKNKQEIDVVMPLKNKLLGIEVKWQEKPEFFKLSVGKMKKVITLTKNVLAEEPTAIPVSLFLACLDV